MDRTPAALKVVRQEDGRCRHGIWPVQACRICRDEIPEPELSAAELKRIEQITKKITAPACQICGTRTNKYKGSGLCDRCYKRGWYRKKHGMGDAFQRTDPPRLCKIEGCDQPHFGHGLCRPHFDAWRRYRRYREARNILYITVDGSKPLPDMIVLVDEQRHRRHIYPTTGVPVQLWEGAEDPPPENGGDRHV